MFTQVNLHPFIPGLSRLMAEYYYLHSREWFEQQLIPAFANSWRRRSFDPLHRLCQSADDRITSFVEGNHLPQDGLLLLGLDGATPFHRALWTTLVGELLLVLAEEVPLISPLPESLRRIPSEQFIAPLHDALFGRRNLVLGSTIYRPGKVGWNNFDDVVHLSKLLDTLSVTNLSASHCITEWTAEEYEDLEDFTAQLRAMYQQSRERNCVVVAESIYPRDEGI